MTWRPEPPSQEQCFKAMRASLAAGSNFWNGGEIYGTPERNSLHLLAEYFEKHPEDVNQVVLSIKGGCEPGGLAPDGSDANIARSIDECLKHLKPSGKKLDLFECARVDQRVPIETSLRKIQEYVDKGLVGGISLSEVSANTIRRAAKVVKVSAVEVEFSLFTPQILTNGIADACAELDIPIIAYSPLSRGLLVSLVHELSHGLLNSR
jgi:pyridoxine 4-dehydrogenase